MTLNQKCGKLLLCSAAVLLAGAPAVSQSHPVSNSGSLGGPAYGGQQPSAPDPAENQMNRDRAFLKKALEEGSVEVRLGELAQQNSQRDDVKEFGRKMVEEHKQLESKIKPIAMQLGVVLATDLSRKDKKVIEKLEGLSGSKFDEEYITMMLKNHQQGLKDFNIEAKKTQNMASRDVAQEGATIISQHLQLIQSIAQSHNVATSR